MAIDDLLDEHEQSERVRAWLRDNAFGLIAGVAIGLGLIGGWKWWQQKQYTQSAQAGERYQTLQQSLQAKDVAKAQAQLKNMDGIHAQLGALQIAKAQVQAGKRDDAIATLRAARSADNGDLVRVIDQRMARLLIEAGKGAEAIKLLGGASDAAALEVLGDAQLATGQRDAARDSYGKALVQLDVGAPQRRLVELKLSEAGGTPPQPEAKS